ncbi:MAG: acyloxyacyl hydrolase [Magnetospirillum sp.]|nr:acyloxyacyl hydrolase [Magnetospirillum sp.]
MRSRFSLGTAVLLVAASPALADSAELRLGVLRHDAGIFGNREEAGVDGNVEVLFPSPTLLEPIWSPRPHLGATVNSAGDTSQIYAGLTWQWSPPVSPVFIEFSLGGAVHNGDVTTRELDRKELGARALFRESLSIGWQIDERNSLSLILDHISNANLADKNEGLDGLGLRWGYRF